MLQACKVLPKAFPERGTSHESVLGSEEEPRASSPVSHLRLSFLPKVTLNVQVPIVPYHRMLTTSQNSIKNECI